MSHETRDFQYANRARSVLVESLSSSATVLRVHDDDADRFPSLNYEDEIFSIVLWDQSLTKFEVVYCTAVNANELTVERGKEGTTAKAFVEGDLVVHTYTAGFLDQLKARAGESLNAPALSGSLNYDQDFELTWTEPTTSEGVTIGSYSIYRATEDGSFSLLDTVDGETLSYVDTTLDLYTNDYYRYKVQAVSDVGTESTFSNIVDTLEPLFIAVSETGTNRIMYSSDGEIWDAASAAPQKAYTSVCFSSALRLFVAVARNTNTADNVVTSEDGINWTERSFSRSFEGLDVVWVDDLGLFVCCGAVHNPSSNSDNKMIQTSLDGINWTERDAAFSTTSSLATLTYSPLLTRIVSYQSDTSRCWYSSDGESWSEAAGLNINPPSFQDQSLWIEDLERFYVSSSSNDIRESATGIGEFTDNILTSEGGRALAYSAKLGIFITGASADSILDESVSYSEDAGATWQLASGTIDMNVRAAMWSERLEVFLAVTGGRSGASPVLKSTDGKDWESFPPIAVQNWSAVCEGIL